MVAGDDDVFYTHRGSRRKSFFVLAQESNMAKQVGSSRTFYVGR